MHGLTQRELQILQMIVDGKSNKEIASVLDLSVNTVAVHRANMMDALGIHKTAELVVYAIRNGLVNASVNRRSFLRGMCRPGFRPRSFACCRRCGQSPCRHHRASG